MALSLKDSEIDALARERLKRGKPRSVREELEEIVQLFSALLVLDGRSPDEIIGYDENGLPS